MKSSATFLHARLTRLLLCCSLFALLSSVALAQSNIIEFPVTRQNTSSSCPFGITYGPDGAYWFCEFEGGCIGRIALITNSVTNASNVVTLTISNTITEYLLTSSQSGNITNPTPVDIVVGPDNTNLWFTEANSNKIGRLAASTTTTNLAEFPLGGTNFYPFAIIVGPDTNVWFSEYNQSKIGMFNPSFPTNNGSSNLNFHEFGPFGASTRFGARGTNAEIFSLTVGPDNNIWFTQASYGGIGWLNPFTGQSNVYYLTNTPGSSNCEPLSITTGADGALWFTEFNTNKIGRITTGGLVTEFPIPTNDLVATPQPYGIVLGHDGKIWFTEFTNSAVGSITTNGIVTLFPTPTQPATPTFLATGNPAFGPDTNIWFGEFPSAPFFNGFENDNVGELILSEALSLTTPFTTIPISGKIFSGTLATFEDSTTNDTVVISWGDGTTNVVTITNAPGANSFAITNTAATASSLFVTNTTPISTNGPLGQFVNGQFSISASHTFQSALSNNFNLILTVGNFSNDVATANILIQDGHPSTQELLAFKSSGTNITLSWPNAGFNLQSAPSSRGPWTTVLGAISPYPTHRSGSAQFFRLQSQ